MPQRYHYNGPSNLIWVSEKVKTCGAGSRWGRVEITSWRQSSQGTERPGDCGGLWNNQQLGVSPGEGGISQALRPSGREGHSPSDRQMNRVMGVVGGI